MVSFVNINIKARSEAALTRIPSLGDRKPLSPTARIAAVGDVVEDLRVGILVPRSAKLCPALLNDGDGTHQSRVDKPDGRFPRSNPLLIDPVQN